MNGTLLGMATLLVLLLMLGLTTVVATQELPIPDEIVPTHPRLFFNGESIERLRKQILEEGHELFDSLKVHLQAREYEIRYRRNMDLGVEAAQAAFVYLITQENRYLTLAQRAIETSINYYEACYRDRVAVSWYVHSRLHCLLAIDWLYAYLPEETRSEYLTRFITVMDQVMNASPWISRESQSGYTQGYYGISSIQWYIGLTAWGTGIRPDLVGYYLYNGYRTHLLLLNHRAKVAGSSGGGASQVVGYVFGDYPFSEFNFLYTYKSATGVNLAESWPHVAYLVNYLFWNWIEGDEGPLEFGYGDTYHLTNEFPIEYLDLHLANIQALYRESNPQGAALAALLLEKVKENKAEERQDMWFFYPFLWEEQAETPSVKLDYSRLPLARNFENMGQIFVRTGWTPTDTYALFSYGGMLDGHNHYDALNFVIYHRGFLALDSGTRWGKDTYDVNLQHLSNYYAQTIAHNCVLIYQPGEPPASYWGTTVLDNYGGQHRKNVGTLEGFNSTEDYVYIAADATATYHHRRGNLPEKAELVTRQFVFLPADYFVVFDRVVSTAPEYEKVWLLHTANEPVVQGSIVQADQGEGRLFCQTLLPQNTNITLVGGPGKEFWTGDKNWSLQGTFTPQAQELMGQWRIEVTNQEKRTDDLFLHVLQVGDRNTEKMVPVELLTGESTRGVRIYAKDDVVWEVCFNITGPLGGSIRKSQKGVVLLDEPFSDMVLVQTVDVDYTALVTD